MACLDIPAILGKEASYLLEHVCEGILAPRLNGPGPDYLSRVTAGSDRSPNVIGALHRLFSAGRLGGTGYLSLLPIDHGIAHTAGMVFAPNPSYLDPKAIVKLAIDGGCSGLVTTYGVLGTVARVSAHRLPLILKLNHDEQFRWPAQNANIQFARVREAERIGCVAVAATVYFGGPTARTELRVVSELFAEAHARGMATILFCYLHPKALHSGHSQAIFAADLTAEANHQGITIQADLIKQKQPTWTGGFTALNYGKTDPRMYSTLSSSHPIDLTRYQVAASYCGRGGVIHSGGEKSNNDLRDAVRAAVINKRGGGMGMLAGRKTFQAPLDSGIAVLRAIQDVYLDSDVTIA